MAGLGECRALWEHKMLNTISRLLGNVHFIQKQKIKAEENRQLDLSKDPQTRLAWRVTALVKGGNLRPGVVPFPCLQA